VSANPGAAWENAAAEYLKRQGAVILARNYRRGPGEVDLIARMDGYVAFIEVKQRSSFADGAYLGRGAVLSEGAQAPRRAHPLRRDRNRSGRRKAHQRRVFIRSAEMKPPESLSAGG
jgi:hypothetical protein